MAVYEVNYYPIQGKYIVQIVERYGPKLELDKIESVLSTNGYVCYVIYVDRPTFAAAVAAASGRFLEANVGMLKSQEEVQCCGEGNSDLRALLVTLIDYFRGGEPALEIARDLEVMLDDLDK